MAKTWLTIVVALLLVAMIGCSQSTTPQVSVAAATTITTAPSLPEIDNNSSSKPTVELASAAHSTELLASTESPSLTPPVTPFSDMGDLFAPPKQVGPIVPVQPEIDIPEARSPEPEKPPLPELQLIGFVDVDGLKALLSVEGKLNVVSAGEKLNGMQIVAIDPPTLTLKQGDDGESVQLNFFEQPWFRQPSAVPNDRRGAVPRPVMPRTPSLPTNIGAPPGPKSPPMVPAVGNAGEISLPKLPGTPASGGPKHGFPPAALPRSPKD